MSPNRARVGRRERPRQREDLEHTEESGRMEGADPGRFRAGT